MAKTNAKNNAPAAPVGPWREGRPSFKAFYPEIILLTILTALAIMLATRLSCAEVKKASPEKAPKAVSSAAPFLASQAFAQDESLDEAEAVAAEPEPEPEPEAEPKVGAAEEPEPEAVAAEPNAEKGAPEAEESAEAGAEPKKEAKSSGVWKYYVIWIGCLIVPVCLWIWRAWRWICAVYGVKFEIRSDSDNPKATTVLVHRGIFNKKTDSMHIAQIKDMQTSQTLWQKYFQGGVGTIRLFTNDLTDGVLEMKNMEEPSRVFNALDELRRRYWALGGIGGFGGQSGAGLEVEGVDNLNDVAM